MRKIKNQKGFTLVEMLVCVITLLLVGAICTTGMGISIKSYQESRFESDSQMLQSTVDMALGDILRFASNVQEENGIIVFNNIDWGILSGSIQIAAIGEGNVDRLAIKENVTSEPRNMIGESLYAGNLKISRFELHYDSVTGIFSGSYDIKSTIMNDAIKTCEFTCRNISSF